MSVDELKQQRSALVAEARKLNDENKDFTPAEIAERIDKIFTDVDALNGKIEAGERSLKLERAEAQLKQVSERRVNPSHLHTPKADGNRSKALSSWFARKTDGDAMLNAEQCGLDITQREIKLSIARPESRAMQVSNTQLAQYNFGQDFDIALKYYGAVKGLVKTVQTPTGLTYPVVTSDDTANMAAIIAEGAAVSLTPDPTTAVVNLGAFMYSTRAIQVSLQALVDSVIPVESYVAETLTERLGRAVNKHITVGTGSGEPHGLVTRASDSAVVVGGTLASPTFTVEQVYDLIASVDPAYRGMPNVGIMAHDNTIWRWRKLKDSTGQFLWQPAVQAGQPDRLAGYPVYTNNDMPTIATGASAKIALFGDYSKYTWREVSNLELRRLDELYIANGLIAWMGFYRASGNLINTAAVKYLSAPAS